MVFMFQLALSQAAAVLHMDGSAQISVPASIPSLESNSSTILYQAVSMETQNFIFRLDEIEEEIVTELSSSCSAIPTMTEQCITHPASCQSSRISKINYENTMINDFQTMYSLQRVCEVTDHPPSDEAIRRCHAVERWAPWQNATAAFPFITGMFDGFTTDYLEQEKEERSHT